MKHNITKIYHINGVEIKIHGFSSGLVSIKNKMRENNYTGLLAQMTFLINATFTEWMPIFSWVIEHPEGIFLIDAGQIEVAQHSEYYNSVNPILKRVNTSLIKYKIKDDENIENQLAKLGIEKSQISKIILTHLHIDHMNGINYFPSTKILVNKVEWEKPYGNLPTLYPKWFKPTKVNFTDTFENFDKAKYLTNDKTMVYIQTSGHTYGHSSVMLKTDEGYLFFSGDLCYSQEQLLTGKFAGINIDSKAAKKTHVEVKEFCENNKVVLLPSHDHNALKRLEKIEFV